MTFSSAPVPLPPVPRDTSQPLERLVRSADATEKPNTIRRLLTAFFLLSGASSLIYQVAWQRLLGLHYGVSAISVSIIVSIFMLGLGLGSLVAGLPVMARRRAIKAYMIIEVAIGAFGLVSLPFLDLVVRISAGASYPLVALCSSLFLLIPTLLMGATLPIALRALSHSATRPLRNVSAYYFANTLGAGIGSLLASFLLVSFVGLDGAIYTAAALNLLLAVALWLLAKPRPEGEVHNLAAPSEQSFPNRILFPAVFIGGFIALGYEIVWFRLLGILLKDSIYSFAILLCVYLVSVALGSYVVRLLVARWKDQRDLYLVLNGGIALVVGLTVCLLFYFGDFILPDVLAKVRRAMILPSPPSDIAGLSKFLLSLAASTGLAALLIGLPALLMGASFPLVAALTRYDPEDPAGAVSRVYFTVILGNVAGALVTGFLLLPLLGSEVTLVAFMLVGLAFFILRTPTIARAVPLAIGMLFVAIFPTQGKLIRFLHDLSPGGTVHVLEGAEGAVVVQRAGERLRLFINGSEHGGRPGPGFHLEGIAALSFAEKPRDVLVIGVGTGSLLEAPLNDPAVASVTLVEINGTVIRALKRDAELASILSHPKLRIIIDDARRWMTRSDRRFDVILMDPLRSATAFSNNIYSEEFFRLQRAHLGDGGVAMIWTDELISIPNTVARVYPKVRLYCDGFMIAAARSQDFMLRPVRFSALLQTFPERQQRAILGHECARSTTARSINFKPALPLNRDHKPRAEYYLGPAVEQLLGLRARERAWPIDRDTRRFADMLEAQ